MTSRTMPRGLLGSGITTLIASLIAMTCGSATAGNAAEIVFLDAGRLSDHQALISELIDDTIARAEAAMDVGSLRVEVTASASRAIPGWGIGGYALGPSTIEIAVDPRYPSLDRALRERLPHIVAHEMHHAVRWRGPGPYSTLLEALVFEGLADRFAYELLRNPLPPWSTAFPERDTLAYLERARPQFDSTFDFEAWFFGVNTDLPRWTGYTLGYRLIVAYQAANGYPSAAALVSTPAGAFRPEGRSETWWVLSCPPPRRKAGGRTTAHCIAGSDNGPPVLGAATTDVDR